jgi:hypothetical protein
VTVTEHDVYERLQAAHAALQDECDLLRIERDQFRLLADNARRDADNAERATEALREKLHARGVLDPDQADEIKRNLSDTERGIGLLVGLYRSAAALGTDVQALAEVSEVVDGMTQRELVGFLIATIRRLAEREMA